MTSFYISLFCSFIAYLSYPLFLVISEWISQKKLLNHLYQAKENADCCFQGRRISSIEDHRLWLQNDGVSLLINLDKCSYYRITVQGKEKEKGIRHLSMKEFREMSEGLGLALYRTIDKQNNLEPRYLVLNSSADFPASEDIVYSLEKGNYFQSSGLNRSFYFGAALNILLLSLSILKDIPAGFLLIQITLTMVPLLPILPPGILLYFLSAKWWRKNRFFFRMISTLSFLIMLCINSVLLFYLLQILLYP